MRWKSQLEQSLVDDFISQLALLPYKNASLAKQWIGWIQPVNTTLPTVQTEGITKHTRGFTSYRRKKWHFMQSFLEKEVELSKAMRTKLLRAGEAGREMDELITSREKHLCERERKLCTST
jgi:hypothetical protein